MSTDSLREGMASPVFVSLLVADVAHKTWMEFWTLPSHGVLNVPAFWGISENIPRSLTEVAMSLR